MNKEILRLAIPNIISNLTVPLIGMVDVALMGHLPNSIYIASVALGSVIFSILFMSFGFLRMSTTGFTAQAYGASNHPEISLSLQRALLIAFGIALLILLLQVPIGKIGFFLLEGDAITKEIARDYYNIRIWSAPATLLLYVWMGWFVGMQDTRTPMMISISINLVNIGLSIIFVSYFQLDVKGVALGSLVAEYLGLLLAFLFFVHKYKLYKKHSPLSTILKKNVLLRFFSINSNLFIRSILLIGSLSYFTSKGASLGNETLAINSIMMQYFFVFSYFMDGFAYAAEALTGKYFGNRNQTLFKQIVSRIFSWGWGLSIAFSLFYLLFHQNLIGLLTDNSRLLENASNYTYWMSLIPITTFAAFLWDGIFVGTLSTVAMRNAMLLAGLLVFLPAVLLFLPLYGNHGLWIAFHLFMGSRSMAMWYFSKTIAVASQSG